MAKKIIILSMLIVSAVALISQAQTDEQRIKKDYNFLQQFYPLFEASEDEKAVLDYIASVCEEEGLFYKPFDFSGMETAHSFSQGLEVLFPGSLNDELLIVVPINSSMTDSNESRVVNPVVGLHLLRVFSQYKHDLNIRILFLGAETDSKYLGTEYFLRDYSPLGETTVFYLDFTGVPDRVLVTTGSKQQISPYWLVQTVSNILGYSELQYLVLGNENQLFRIGYHDEHSALAYYLGAEFPALRFSGTELNMENLLPWVVAFTEAVKDISTEYKSGFPQDWDRHYLFFQILDFRLIVREFYLVLAFLIILFLSLVYFYIFPERVKRYLHFFKRNFLTLPMLVAVVFAFLFISSFFIYVLLDFMKFQSLWQDYLFVFLALKLTMSLGFTMIFFRKFRYLHISIHGKFYSSAAIAILLVDIFLVAFINFSLTYYFLWAYVFAFLFSVIKKRKRKLVCFLISPIFLIKLIIDVVSIPSTPIARVLLFSWVRGNLLLTFLLLPFLLMFIRLGILFRIHPTKKRHSVLRWSHVFFNLFSVSLLVFIVFFSNPYTEAKQKVHVGETVSGDLQQRSLVFESRSPIPLLVVRSPIYGQRYFRRVSNYELTAAYDRDYIEIVETVEPFLNRQTFTYEFNSAKRIHEIDVTLIGDTNLLINDCNFPYSLESNLNRAVIHIGSNPPENLSISFNIPNSVKGHVKFRFVFLEKDEDLLIDVGNKSLYYTMEYTKTVPFNQSRVIARTH